MTAAPAIEIGIFSGMDSGVRWQGFDAQVAVDWLLRTPDQMPPKNPNTQLPAKPSACISRRELRLDRMNPIHLLKDHCAFVRICGYMNLSSPCLSVSVFKMRLVEQETR